MSSPRSDTIPTPQFVNGCPVLSAIKVPAVEAEDAVNHWWVVTEDTGRYGNKGSFSVWEVVWDDGGYRSLPFHGFDYDEALVVMARMAGLIETPRESEGVEKTLGTCGKLAFLLGQAAGTHDPEVMLQTGDGGLFSVGVVEERVVDGRSVVVIEIGEWLGKA